MDPISVAASVAGLLSLTIKVSQILNEQVHTLKNALKDATKLLDELEALRQVLTSLEQFLASQSSEGRSFKETSVLINAIQGCKTQISTVKLRLEKFVGKHGLAQMIERGKWYYEHGEHQELIQTLHRYLGIFHVSLSIDGIKLLSKSADDVAQDIKSIKSVISALIPDPLEVEAKSKQLDDILSLLLPLPTTSKEISEVTEIVRRLDLKSQDKESCEILDWLSPLNFWTTQDDTLSRREPGTAQWIFQEPAFNEWLDGGQRTLWCPGMPGAGKTVLASAVIDHIRHAFPQEDIGLAFIYCNYKQTEEQTIVNLIASLLHQLLLRRTLPTKVCTMYQQHIRKRTRPTVTECLELLRTELSGCSKAFIVIDALDECNDSNETRSTLVDELLRLPTTTHLMVTSRYLPSIETQLSGLCRLEICASDADVRTYLEKEIQRGSRLRRHVQADPSLKDAILDSVVNAAQGMFLLAQLHMDALAQKHTPKAIRTALEGLPRELDKTYDEAMKRIRSQNTDDVELAQRVLTWISFALRPLTVTEMRHAMAIEPNQTRIDEDNLIEEEILVSVCAGLVIIDQESEVIRLIHYTTQEYFERNRQNEFPDGQTGITMTCLAYLSFEVFHSGYCNDDRQMEARLQANPLFQYAAQNWGNHARGRTESILQIQILKFLAREPELSSMVQAMQLSQYKYKGYSQSPPKVIFGLWVTAEFGLAATVVTLLAGDVDLNIRTDRGETALCRAASRGHEGVARLLLEKGADIAAIDSYSWTALYGAVSGGHESIVQLLLEKSADVTAIDKDGRTILHRAVSGGYEGVVQLLLEKGADVAAIDEDGWTALHGAALGGHEGVVQLLLEKGSNIEATANSGWTALHGATSGGHESTVRLLLEKGADVTATDVDGWTALHRAALGGYEVVVQLLLENGANVVATTNSGWTVLHGAASRGHGGIVRLLLEKSADVTATDVDGWTALHRAALGGYEVVVQLLLENGANVVATTNSGWTVLHGAASRGHEGIVRLLLEKGADVTAIDKDGRMALYRAELGGHEGVVQLLLEKGTNVTATDMDSWMALRRAALGGYKSMIQLLLGADVMATDIDGWMVLHGAARGNEGMARLLLEKVPISRPRIRMAGRYSIEPRSEGTM